jgi:hypothetical protein
MTCPSHAMKLVPRRADGWLGEAQIPTLSDLFAAVHPLGLEGQEDATVGGAREPLLSDWGDADPAASTAPVGPRDPSRRAETVMRTVGGVTPAAKHG